MDALFFILRDEEVNRFLPWYPVKSMDETRKFYEERYASKDGLPYITATHDRNRLSILSSRTYPIHVVKRNGNEWNNYINFRDYLNSFPQKAEMYDNYKQSLAIHFSENRRCYTEKKRAVIASILEQANYWRSNNMSSLTGKDYEI